MLIDKEKSAVVLVDVQEKLHPHVLEPERVSHNCEWILDLATELHVPIIVSEQYPRGLSHTIKPLHSYIAQDRFVEKTHFSCCGDAKFMDVWRRQEKKQAILVGIETHVCILQSALELKEAGFEVFVVVNAVSARNHIDHKYGLERMKQQRIHLVTCEMIFFEWIKNAEIPNFKNLSQKFLQNNRTL